MTEKEETISEAPREQYTIIVDKDFIFAGGLAQYNYRLLRHGKYWTDGTFKAKEEESHIELLREVLDDVERKVENADNGNGPGSDVLRGPQREDT